MARLPSVRCPENGDVALTPSWASDHVSLRDLIRNGNADQLRDARADRSSRRARRPGAPGKRRSAMRRPNTRTRRTPPDQRVARRSQARPSAASLSTSSGTSSRRRTSAPNLAGAAAGRDRRFAPVHRRRVRAPNASTPLPVFTAEGPGEPVRHRYNPGGNRAILHRMAVTEPRCEPRAKAIYASARRRAHQEGRPAASSSDTSPTSSTAARSASWPRSAEPRGARPCRDPPGRGHRLSPTSRSSRRRSTGTAGSPTVSDRRHRSSASERARRRRPSRRDAET